jgi:hypothetical protein
MDKLVIYQNMAKLIAGSPIWRRPNIVTNVVMSEHCTLTVRILDAAKFTALIPLSLPTLCKLSFPIIGLKMPSLPTLALKSPKKFIWGIYLAHVPIPHRSCPSHHSFYPLLGMNIQNYDMKPASS